MLTMADVGRPSEEWASEQEIVDFLVSDKKHLEYIIGAPVKSFETEVTIPKGLPRAGSKDVARIDILVIDVEDRWHILEVKHPRNELLENAKGIAQLLFYEAMVHEKEGITATSMNLVTSSFDVVTSEIVPRNNLKIRIVKASKDGIEIITGFTYKNGRPKEYRDVFVEDVYKYVVECANKTADGDVFLPTVEGLAKEMGYSKETIYQWAKEKQDFSDALEFLKNSQCVDLVNKGLAGKFNPTIAKLVLSANHGMREKTDVTTDDKQITFNLVTDVSNKYATDRGATTDSAE